MVKITLKAAIINSGYTLERLANELGITRQAVWIKVKNYKKMRAEDLAKICKIINFDITLIDLEE